MTTQTKDCSRCGETKLIGDFYKRYGKPRSECKECTKADKARYESENSEKIKQTAAEYRKKNRAKLRVSAAEYRKANREKCLERTMRWRHANYDAYIEYRKRYYLENREEILQKGKQYYIDNPHARVTQEQRRRARKASVSSDFTPKDWTQALTYFEYKCAYCRKEAEVLQQEHIIPVAKGGGYTPSNTIPSCSTCNLSKFTRDMESWFKKEPFYTEEALTKITQFVESYARKACS